VTSSTLPPEPPLHRAARLGDIDELQRLISEGEDINSTFNYNETYPYWCQLTPLIVAAMSIDGATVETLQWLINHGAKLEATSAGGENAIFYISGDSGAFIAFCLSLRASGKVVVLDNLVRDQTFNRSELLDKNLDFHQRLQYLLDLAENNIHCHVNWNNLLNEACTLADVSRVSLLLCQAERFNSTSRKINLDELLSIAVHVDVYECANLLITSGANPNSQSAWQNLKSLDMLNLLISASEENNYTDSYNYKLKYFLEGSGDLENNQRRQIINAIFDTGVDINWCDRNGSTYLHIVAIRCDKEAIELLLSAGVNPHLVDNHGNTALHNACWYGGYQREEKIDENITNALELLITTGIDINIRNKHGFTPLHKASGGDGACQTKIYTLLKHGADLDSVTNEGFTPLMLALIYFPELHSVRHLLAAGANPLIVNSEGKTALDYAHSCYEFCYEKINEDLQALEMAIACLNLLQLAVLS
jgi:ankyrin repeat protein